MNILEERILKDGIVKSGNVLKVDSFLNHQVDVALLEKMGREFRRRFADKNINKVLTIEASGIGIAAFVAKEFGVPMVFAKKSKSVNIDGEISAEIIDETGEVIAKSEKFIGDSVKAKLNFNGFSVSSLNGKNFKIKFTVNGKFYSFGFTDKNGDFNGYHGAGRYNV